MIESYRQLFALLSTRQRRDFLILQILMALTAFAELIGVASIMPFMAVAATPELIETNSYLNLFYVLIGEPPTNKFLLYIGLVFIMLICGSNALLLVSQFLMNRYSQRLGGEFASSLYRYYLGRDVLFHGRTNSAGLIQHIMRDTQRLGTHFIAPALRLNGRLFSVVLLSLLIFYVDFVVAMSTVVCLGGIYWFVFYALRSRIYENGKHISADNARRNKQLNESFEGIRDVKLYGAEPQLAKQFNKDTHRVTRSLADNMILGQSPYYLVETLVLVGTLLIALYFMLLKGGIEAVLPVLTLYVMAGFKLVPKVQQSYLAITQMRSALPVFRSLKGVLEEAAATEYEVFQSQPAVHPKRDILLTGVTYSYPTSIEPVVQDVNLRIPVGSVVAITGGSGGGKSTLLEILMGLLKPDSGFLSIDGSRLLPVQMQGWQRSVGYVPQSVYLTDASIAENIAFGVPEQEIDPARLQRAAKLTVLSEFISSLNDGFATRIGERGMLLSGGQRQRLGIARALYRDISVIILDEATSALDSPMQQQIFTNLVREESYTILMVTHREETLEFADLRYELSGGRCEGISKL